MNPETVRTLFLVVLALAALSLARSADLDESPAAVSIPLELEINGAPAGEIIVRADPTLVHVELEGNELRARLVDRAADEMTPLLDALPVGYHPIERFQERGLEIDLDLERLVVVLRIQERHASARRGPQSISLGYQRVPNFDAHAPQAVLSGYANLRLRHVLRSDSDRSSTRETTLGLSHVLNLAGFALEGESLFSSEAAFETREIRLVKDFPKQLLRLSAGDLSTPINELQRGFQLFGVGIAKEFGIQPYRTFTPTSSAAFALDETSTVNVRVNGSLVRTLRLEPGSYNIDEFKLAAGPNQMELEILTDSGLADSLQLSEFGSLSLLDADVSTFAVTFGYPRGSPGDPDASALSAGSWYQRYLAPDPILSAYYKKGITNQWTATADAQGNDQWNRFGLSAHAASDRLGAVGLSLSQNRLGSRSPTLSARLVWSRDIHGTRVSLSSLYASRGFNRIDPLRSDAPSDIRSSHSLSLSKFLNEKINVSASVLRQRRWDGSAVDNLNASVGKRFKHLYASLSLRYHHDRRGHDYGAFVNLTWNPARNWRARSRARVSSLPGGTSLSTQLDYADRKGDAFLNARLEGERSDTGYDLSGSFRYQTGLYEVALDHLRYYGAIDDYLEKGDQTSLTLKSAVAFADGAFGFANEIRNSFAIVSRHRAWSEAKLGINPTVGGFQKTSSHRLVSPVLSTLLPYREEYATIQTFDSDLFLERNDYYFFPGYRRGTHLMLGDDAIYSLRGSLCYDDGSPVPYKAVQFVSDDGETVNTFTNGAGRFMATGLRSGRYRISVAGSEQTVAYTIQEGDTLQNAGRLALQTPDAASR